MRHAEDTPRNSVGPRCDGDMRLLTSVGRRQAADAARWFASRRITELRTSSLTRARQCADVLAGALGLPVQEDPRLNEIVSESGDRGLPPPRERRNSRHPRGVESWDEFLGRVARCLSDLCREPAAERRIVLVTHSGFFDAMHELIGGGGKRMELQVEHVGITHWQYRPGCPAGTWLLHRHNLTPAPSAPSSSAASGGVARIDGAQT